MQNQHEDPCTRQFQFLKNRKVISISPAPASQGAQSIKKKKKNKLITLQKPAKLKIPFCSKAERG